MWQHVQNKNILSWESTLVDEMQMFKIFLTWFWLWLFLFLSFQQLPICNKSLSFYYRPTYFWLHVSISEAVGILKSKTFTNNLKLVSKLFRLEASNLFIVRWMKFHSRNEKSDETNLLPNYLEWIWMRPRHESFQHASVLLLKFT